MDVAKRLEELRCMDLFDFDGQMHLSLRSSSIIVAAEIIADAIKEAAPAKPEPLTIHLSQEESREEIAEKLRNQLGKADL